MVIYNQKIKEILLILRQMEKASGMGEEKKVLEINKRFCKLHKKIFGPRNTSLIKRLLIKDYSKIDKLSREAQVEFMNAVWFKDKKSLKEGKDILTILSGIIEK